MLALQSAFGFIAICVIAWLMSEDRRAVPWRIVVAGALLQLALAALLLWVPLFRNLFLALNDLLSALEQATREGTRFVFGFLGGGPTPFGERPGTSSFVLAFRALPLILVVSALSALLFYWRVLPAVVRAVSAVLEKTLGIGGAAGLSAAANIFVGMVEAPLVVRPYLKALSRGELFIVMSCGMAVIAGAAGLAGRHTVAGGGHRRSVDGNQDRAQRAHRVRRACRLTRGSSWPAQPPHHDLLPVRLC